MSFSCPGVDSAIPEIWEKFPKFANDFQGVAAQDISREQGGMTW
jgi:hypothetical protein